MVSARLFMAAAALALAACGTPPRPPTPDAQVILGPPTLSSCPTPAVTYSSFGQTFFEAYCTRCHSRSVTGADRNGAPSDHNFESAADIRMWITAIDQLAASGPNATNEQMPFLGTEPSVAERQELGQLLACGVPD